MKKVVLSVAIMSFALLANAQVLKKDLLKDYKPGDQLEKAVYGDKKEPIRTDSWNGAFSTNPLEGVGSPLVGKALSYKGYPEGGLSILPLFDTRQMHSSTIAPSRLISKVVVLVFILLRM